MVNATVELRDATDPYVLDHADLIVGSPPYAGKERRYGKFDSSVPTWTSWMENVTHRLMCRFQCPIVWVVNGPVKKSRYDPAVERLMVGLHDLGYHLERPVIWHKNPPPNRKDWFVNAWEYILCVKPPGSVPTFNWEAIATPPKYTSGGRFRQRTATGERKLGGEYPKGKLTRPRDVWYIPVGGGQMGSKLAHENEAPYPEALASRIISVLTHKGHTVLDPFCGSGTTLAAAMKLGRHAIGWDNRQSQVELTQRRITEVRDLLTPKESK